MTTAHRPTFHPARGGTGRSEGDLSKLSQQYSSKDMPSHTKLKYRQTGQGTEEELRRRDLRRELEEKEKVASRERRGRDAAASSSTSKRARLEEISHAAVDADEPLDEPDSSDDDSDEDDTAALMAELERIKKERADEKAAREEEEKKREEKIRMDNILAGNPLLNVAGPSGSSSANGGEFKVKRRWDDDVVFKNCAKGIDERKKEASFINDAIRSEFHRKFMDKSTVMEDEKTTETPVAEKPEKCLDDVKINERVVVYRLVNGENRRVFAKVIKKRNRSSNAQSGNANDEGKEQEQTTGANESEPKPADEMEYLVHFDGQDRRLDQWITYNQFVERAPRNTNGDGGGCDLRLTRKRRRENEEDIPLEELGGRNDHHRKTPPEKNIESIIFGSYEIQCWYYSPYRVKHKTVDKLFVCENCLLYSETRDRYACHLANDCRRKHPPGDIIYEEGDIRVYEVFGALEKLYCQLLCLLAKLFIDHKTLSFDVENFIFYLLCEVDSDGVHIAGMFSKEMYSANNLACIMTLPCYQRKGYGNLMIQLSYEMSKRARYAGTPERPFSDLGEISYKKYWLFVLLEFFDSMEMRKVEDVTLDDLEALVGINKDDIRDTMEPIGLVSHLKGGTYVVHNPKLDQESAVERPRPPLRRLVPQYLMWNPRNFDRPKRRN